MRGSFTAGNGAEGGRAVEGTATAAASKRVTPLQGPTLLVPPPLLLFLSAPPPGSDNVLCVVLRVLRQRAAQDNHEESHGEGEGQQTYPVEGEYTDIDV